MHSMDSFKEKCMFMTLWGLLLSFISYLPTSKHVQTFYTTYLSQSFSLVGCGIGVLQPLTSIDYEQNEVYALFPE